ncbi:collagen-like protein [Christiangramia sp. LLG6405-1]|uniref:collagen-like protein n=1 Tax=Christiangramia sp. LLG6405-1 TaxID=3160832 RepID=UPI00386B65B6
MKKLLSLILIASTIVACSSDGEVGPPGPPGQDGVNIVGQAFEIEADFNDPDYSVFADIPSTIEVLESDVVLVYWLELVDDGTDVWNLIPQTIYFDDGEFQYNYNHTSFDVNIYLQGNIDLGTLGERYTQDQIFKIVVLPVDYAQDNNLDVSDYQSVKTSLDLNDSNIKRFEVK